MANEETYYDLLEESFGGIKETILRCQTMGFHWNKGALFTKERNRKIIAHVSLLECQVLIDKQWHSMGALHAICTQKTYRKQGIASELIQEAIEWSKNRCKSLFLFTDIPDFYQKLGFHLIQEYRFYLTKIKCTKIYRLTPVIFPYDNERFLRCFQEREPLSNYFWIKDTGFIASFNSLFATYPTYWSLYYSHSFDGFLCYQIENNTIHLYDIIAKIIPPLEMILNHFPEEIEKIYFYFSPDRLTDKAFPEPYLYDSGHLLMYGKWQFSQPFMISPLSRC